MKLEVDCQSTESITKFLRNKDTEVEDIYSFTIDKLFSESSDVVYLPQKERFILTLVVDRISQSNKLSQKFKQNEKTWKLFNYTWNKCKNENRLLIIRSKILSKLKFGEVFSKLLDDINEEELYKNTCFIEELAISIEHLIKNLKIYLSDDQNLSLVKNLLNFVVKNGEFYPKELTVRLLNLVVLIFNINNNTSVGYDTKHKSEFSRCCLGNILIANEKYSQDSQIAQGLGTVIDKILFSKGSVANVVTFVEQFASAESNKELGKEEVLHLLKLTMTKVGMTELESIVKILVEFNPLYSSLLLKEITDMNKTLSTDFLSSLVERALKTSDVESYLLIIHSIRRSAEVALKYTEPICKFCCTGNSVSLDLFKELIDSYFKSREIESFVTLWAKIIKQYPNEIFESDEIIDYVSSKLITLSYNQLSKLLETETETFIKTPTENPVFLLAVCKGLMRGVSGSIQNALSKTLILNLFQLKPLLLLVLDVNSECSWKLKFYILSLFDAEDIENSISQILGDKTIDNDYYYYAMLRIYEQNIELINTTFAGKFSSYYLTKSTDEFQQRIFSRFFLIIEIIFDKKLIVQFVGKLLESSQKEQVIKILQNHILQTQPKIMHSVINYMIENTKSLEYAKYLSVYSFNKFQKEKVLNLLLNQLDQEYATLVMEKLLKMPTYKSDLETKFGSLIDLAQVNRPEYNNIIEKIISLHLKQPVESKEYIDMLFKKSQKLLDKFSKRGSTKYHRQLTITLILIKQSLGSKCESERTKLIATAFESTFKVLSNTSQLDSGSVCFILDFLTQINLQLQDNQFESEEVKRIVNNIGIAYYGNGSVMDALFEYMCSFVDIYRPEYIAALFVVLENEKNKSSIEMYICRLANDETQFIKLWFSICDSIQTTESDLQKYLELLTFMIKYVKKTNDSANVKSVHMLYVLSLSQVFVRLNELNYSSLDITLLLDCLKTVSSTKIWLFTQYSTELTIAFLTHVAKMLPVEKSSDRLKKEYIDLCQTVSAIVLYQRHRLSNRHHLINTIFISLMKALLMCSNLILADGALAFERLIGNFCEPNIHHLNIRHGENKSKDSEISDALTETKANLRKYVPVLILNYIRYYLQFQFDLSIKPHVDNSIYMMLDLLTLNELNYINRSLDNQGRLVFQSIYEEYKKFYKWNED